MTPTSAPDSAAVRMHHYEWVTADQEATRAFYEDMVGLPLVCVWTEEVERDGRSVAYVHSQYGLADGAVLSFFSFADADDRRSFAAAPPGSPFVKMALLVTPEVKADLERRFLDDPRTAPVTWRRDHGYCASLYTRDPNGLVVEFTVDAPEAADRALLRRENAHADLRRWLTGDTRSNNLERPRR
jgi:glyoxylase I family protein